MPSRPKFTRWVDPRAGSSENHVVTMKQGDFCLDGRGRSFKEAKAALDTRRIARGLLCSRS